MLKRLTVLAGIAAVGVTGLTALAIANEPYLPRSERSFNKLDADKDGKVSRDELRPRAIKRVLRLDTDGDGQVSSAEIDSWLNKIMERRKVRLLAHLDTDKNGLLTEAEVGAYVDTLVDRADNDHDGAVTLAEVRDSLAKRAKAPKDSQGN
ncbi:hypothetical protein BH10PSE7_BH10PSE7_03980 [soil metagenome]